MDNRIKVFLFAIVGLILSAFLAGQIGDGNYLPAIVVSALSLVLGILLFIFPRVSFDASVITLSTAGVMIAGKGYSYIGVGGVLYITEIILFCALVGYFVRIIFQREPLLPPTPLALPFALLIGYMIFHLFFDSRQYGLLAFRDACMIYYTGFFMAAYLLAKQEAWRHQLKVIILLTAPFAIAIMVAIRFLPGIMQKAVDFFTFAQRPFFSPHGDAADHVFLGMMLYLYQRATRARGMNWPYYLGIILIGGFLIIAARGTLYVSLLALAGFLLYSGQFRFFLALILPGLFSIGLFLAVYTYSDDFRNLAIVERVEDELQSFEVPWSSQEAVEGDGQSTASWRLEWWSWIYDTVNKTNPSYGLGLGADLYIGFARHAYGYEILGDQAATRGAHSELFTILGRMGYIGAGLFFWIVGIQLWYFRKAAIMWRTLGSKLDPFFLYLQGGLITFFCTTFFEYSWLGPYSALPFWTFTGVSVYLIDQYYRGKIEPEWNEGKVISVHAESEAKRLLPEAATGLSHLAHKPAPKLW